MKLLRCLAEFRVRRALARRGPAKLCRGGVGKAQHRFAEVFVKLLGLVDDGQIMALLSGRRRHVKMTVALEYRARYLAVHLSIKGKFPATKREGSCIAVQVQIVYRDHLVSRQKPAQLLVNRVGIARVLSLRRSKARSEKKENGDARYTGTNRHRQGPLAMIFCGTTHSYSARGRFAW